MVTDLLQMLAPARVGRRVGKCGVVLVVAIASASVTAVTAESWEVLLKAQLQEQQRCDLERVISMREVPLGSSVGIEGRIKCADGREFDFKREREHERFTIRLCQPAVC